MAERKQERGKAKTVQQEGGVGPKGLKKYAREKSGTKTHVLQRNLPEGKWAHHASRTYDEDFGDYATKRWGEGAI